jgi:hypothetical protein
MRRRWLVFAVLAILVFSNVAAAQQQGGTIRGYVFRDSNGNGVFDEGEEGLPDVLVTISLDKYEHTYYTGKGDASPEAAPQLPSPSPGPGSYGPTPLQAGYWKVTLHVPDGYRATTPTEVYVNVPEGRSTTGVNFGIYGSGDINYGAGTGVGMGGGAPFLPVTGRVADFVPAQLMALIAVLVGLVVLVGTPWCVTRTRRTHKRWW